MGDWIQGAVKNPGAFTKKANSAGMSVSKYTQKEKGKGGKTGAQARLVITLKKLRPKMGK